MRQIIIDKDHDFRSDYAFVCESRDPLVCDNMDPIAAPETSEEAADRRYRLSEGLDGWDYQRLELTGGPTTGLLVRDPTKAGYRATVDFFVWIDSSTTYLAGGLWAYDVGEDTETRGAGIIAPVRDRDFRRSTNAHDMLPAANSGVADAYYAGHTFGRYSVLPALLGEANNGWFAARAILKVDFTNPNSGPHSRGVSGTIFNFLFSKNKTFSDGAESALEKILGGLSVRLKDGEGTDNIFSDSRSPASSQKFYTFRGDTIASVMVGGEPLDLTGKYAGVFLDPQGPEESPEAPVGVGGTWGAAGETGDTTPETGTGGFGISFVGSFGAGQAECDPSQVPTDSGCRARREDDCTGATPVFVGSSRTCRRRVLRDCTHTIVDGNITESTRYSNPVVDQDTYECREREARDCTGATPILNSEGQCRPADNDAECTTRNPAMPVEDGGACRAPEPQERRIASSFVSLSTLVLPEQTAAYEEIFNAAKNEPGADMAAQSENAYNNGRTRDYILEPAVTRGLANGSMMFGHLDIDSSGNFKANYILNEGTAWIDPPILQKGRENEADDRRFRPNEGLDGWNYRTYDMSGNAVVDPEARIPVVDPEGNEATADIILWSDPNDHYYLAGGVWMYELRDGTERRGAGFPTDSRNHVEHGENEEEEGEGWDFPDPASTSVDDATYTGHSFGHYAVLPAPHAAGRDAEPNRGFFAAKARLNVDFSGGDRGISGTISNFLFSTDEKFEDDERSALEDALGGLEVSLQRSPGFVFFEDEPYAEWTGFRGNTLATVDVDGETLELSGKYGGLFIGPDVNFNGIAQAPDAVGGTWGASGATTRDTPTIANGGFGISFIGAFGAKLDEEVEEE